jgi:TonB family protein
LLWGQPMKWSFTLFIFLIYGSLVGFLQAEDQSDIRQTFVKAAEQADLRSPGSQPFELGASVEAFGAKGQSSRGTYRLLWASQSEWREQIIFPGYERTRVGGSEKYWQERSINYELPQILQLDQALEFPSRLRNSAATVAGKLKTETLKGLSLECAHSKSDYEEGDFCFDSTRGPLMLEKLPHGAGGGLDNTRAREYSDFTAFGQKLFPRSIRVVGQDQPSIVFSVDKLTPLGQTMASDFNPQPGAQEWLTCSHPEPPKLKHRIIPIYPEAAKTKRIQGRVALYALIGPDGMVHNLKVMGSLDPLLDESAFQAVSQWQYEPRKCGDRSTLVDIFIDVIFSLN